MAFIYIVCSIIGGAAVSLFILTSLNAINITLLPQFNALVVLTSSLACYYCTVLIIFNSLRQARILSVLLIFAITIISYGYLGIMQASHQAQTGFIVISIFAYLLYFGLLEAILRLYAPIPDHCKFTQQ